MKQTGKLWQGATSLLLAGLLLPLLAVAACDDEVTHYIHAGTLLTVPGEPPRQNVTLVVKGERIHRIYDGFMAPAGDATVVYLQDHFVLPGLMDAHVHLIGQPSAFMRAARNRGRPITAAQLTMNAALYAQRTLAAGFTTVRDVGSNDESVFAPNPRRRTGDFRDWGSW